MSTPVLGELLPSAAGQINLALSCPQPLDDAAKAAAIRQLDRLTGALARYALDVTISGEPDIAGSPFTGIRQARTDTRTALQHAAESTRRAAVATGTSQAASTHPAVGHLSRAADCLAAGCDLPQTHFTTDSTGLRTGISRWASLIWSRPAATIVLSEMARYAASSRPGPRSCPWPDQPTPPSHPWRASPCTPPAAGYGPPAPP